MMHNEGPGWENRGGANRITGAPGEIRTPDLMLRRHSLYPAELRARSCETCADMAHVAEHRISL